MFEVGESTVARHKTPALREKRLDHIWSWQMTSESDTTMGEKRLGAGRVEVGGYQGRLFLPWYPRVQCPLSLDTWETSCSEAAYNSLIYSTNIPGTSLKGHILRGAKYGPILMVKFRDSAVSGTMVYYTPPAGPVVPYPSVRQPFFPLPSATKIN